MRTLLFALLVAAAPATAQTVHITPPPAPPPPPRAYDDDREPADLSGPPTFTGTLTDRDPVRDGDTPVDTYTTTVQAGDEVTVTMSSDDFDTYLVVRQPNGREQANDDFGSTRVSQVRFDAAQAGTATIQATAYGSRGRGDYEVRVSAVRATVVSTVPGRLDYQDRQQIKGEFYDELAVRTPPAGQFYIELTTLGFPGYLRVSSPGGVQTRSETRYSYGEDRTPVRVGPFAAERGTWTVDVTSADASSPVGAYDLRVITME